MMPPPGSGENCCGERGEVMPLLSVSQSVKTIKSLRQMTSRVDSMTFPTIEEEATPSPATTFHSLLVPSGSKQPCKPRVSCEEVGQSVSTNSSGHQNGTLLPCLPQPLITVTINPLEKNEITFVPSSPLTGPRGPTLMDDEERKLSIGSASSFDEEDDMNALNATGSSRDIRRVSDISHINELRREISGLSHLASEYYEVKKADPDSISLDSIHVRVLGRCAKYQVRESKSDRSSRYFVIITTSLTIIGISCGFWYKNFSGMAEEEHMSNII